MITRIQKALAARRSELQDEKGFTLIELLVVVIIIGILAAIAIPVYIGVQNNAKDSAMVSDLTNAKVAVVAYFTDNPNTTTTPTFDNAATTGLQKYGYTLSSGNVIAFKGTPTSTAFCLDGTSTTTKKFFITQTAGAVAGSCP